MCNWNVHSNMTVQDQMLMDCPFKVVCLLSTDVALQQHFLQRIPVVVSFIFNFNICQGKPLAFCN